MLRIRFHGRGGQGMKTASRILGSAAFHAGLMVQDSPVYGAERRGAPMMAFTRIAHEPIRERGMIAQPDVIVVADTSLLPDQTAQPLAGCYSETVVLLNTSQAKEAFLSLGCDFQSLHLGDFTRIVETHTKTVASLSTALGAAASALIGLTVEDTLAGVEAELRGTHLSAAQREANQRLAQFAYTLASDWPVVQEQAEQSVAGASPTLVDLSFNPPRQAAPSIYATGNSPERRTGNWRQFRPVLQPEKCTRCWICFVRCPEAAISLDSQEYPVVDYTECKGCLLCAHECPTHAFTVEEEKQACPDNC